MGFAYHDAGEYVRADSAYQAALRAMPARDRCEWEDISLLLDEELLPRYRAQQCGDSARLAFERRVWWLARPLFSTAANDARTEHYARVTMVQMLTEAPSAHEWGFDEDERELLLRYSWPRAWSRAGGGFGSRGSSVVGHEPTPAYPYLPNAFVYDNPVNTDSLRWTTRPGRGSRALRTGVRDAAASASSTSRRCSGVGTRRSWCWRTTCGATRCWPGRPTCGQRSC